MSLDQQTRQEPKKVLQDTEVHDQWVGHFRSAENEPFYELAFNYIGKAFGPASDSPVFDAGCGTGTKSFHLAARGYQVVGLDISEHALGQAREAASKRALSAKIEFRQADLTAIAADSQSVTKMICWGVLMHVPEIDKAVAELSRLVAPGGSLIISEGNKRSLQAFSLRLLQRLFKRSTTEILSTPAGIEFWEQTATGRFMTRQADIPWLIREFEKHGLRLRERRAGQFTEIFTVVPWKAMRAFIHAFNNAWFRLGLPAGPAFGNILTFERPRS